MFRANNSIADVGIERVFFRRPAKSIHCVRAIQLLQFVREVSDEPFNL